VEVTPIFFDQHRYWPWACAVSDFIQFTWLFHQYHHDVLDVISVQTLQPLANIQQIINTPRS
jgi:hypothetical protein